MKHMLILAALLVGSNLWAAASSAWTDDAGVTWHYSRDYSASAPSYSAMLLPAAEGLPCTDHAEGDITLPAKVGKTDRVWTVGEHALKDCTGLTSVTIPESVGVIGNEAFLNCSGLRRVSFPDPLPSIGTRAFWGCTSLPSDGTFRYSDETKTLLLAPVAEDGLAGEVVIPEGVQTIAGCVFYNLGLVTSVTFPEGLRRIGESAFE